MKTTNQLMAEIKIKMAKLAKAISKQPEPPKKNNINLWRLNNSRKNSNNNIENTLNFYKHLK